MKLLTKKELLKQIGWSEEELEHFMVDDSEFVSNTSQDYYDSSEHTTTETHTICFRTGIAETKKIIVR